MDDEYLLPGLENFSLADIEQISTLNVHSTSMRYPLDNLLPAQNFAGLFIHQPDYNSTLSTDNDNSDRKRKAMEFGIPGRNTPADFSPQVSGNGISRKNGTEAAGRGKKVKRSEKKEMNPMEVVHVRAKRGQATDSHSIAERVRREKINERLRCLQDIVPGCYKTMGMAVMLDEIINYVQSLQNQVEFLSMKLTAASTFHDFNSETDTLESMQRAKPIEAIKMNQNEVSGCVDFGPLGLNFEYGPQFPYNR